MTVHVKLMGVLRSKLPGGKADLQVDEQSTVESVLSQLELSQGQIHLVMLNGEAVKEVKKALHDGDELTIFPPVAGG
ncbi:MAG: hypothetical protein KatS3mg105_2888 [Gemmatales bacterium]|nr:MAG: hypothetical protein KatS3mg105_2888 [Gemmatales bacterium]